MYLLLKTYSKFQHLKSQYIFSFPALAGEGVSWALINLEPCSQNMPSHNPRATEFIFVINGSNLTTGHVDENGGKVVVNRGLRAGQSTLVPKGLIHFEQNNGCGVVTYLSAFNSEDPGAVTSGLRLWSLPEAAVSAAFGRPAPFFSVQASNFPGPGIANGRSNPECAARCRLRF